MFSGVVAGMAPGCDSPCILASSAAFPEHAYSQAEVLAAVSQQHGFSAGATRLSCLPSLSLIFTATFLPLRAQVRSTMRRTSADDLEFGLRIFPATSMRKGNISLPPSQLGKKMDRKEFRVYIHNSLRGLSMAACSEALYKWGEALSDVSV